ncbi:diguanylate cyclase AdrA [Yokenella regensburgei]|uniref:diguanylate cyclase AdrA n=1 Tax=Yokenella regensburgei TaxID=158877 RepID=UPI003F13527E
MFPKIMSDNSFYTDEEAGKEGNVKRRDEDRYSDGLHFARRERLPRAVGLACLFFPLAAELVSRPTAGGWWVLLVLWTFVWPHLAWQLSSRSSDPLTSEIHNLKADAIFAGVWMALTGLNLMPSLALAIMVITTTMCAGGTRLCIAAVILTLVSGLTTLKLTGVAVNPVSSPFTVWLTVPVLLIYPLLFSWVSYRTMARMEEHRRRLQEMSIRDGMTGVYNRRHWETLLRSEYDHSRRHQRVATLLLIDVDHFKLINDTHGHDIGDEAIIAITRHLQLSLRGSDVIGRFGGDEFAIIMGGTSSENAIAAMARVHDRLATFRLTSVPQLELHISVGIASLTEEMTHHREWLKSADLALYKAKKAGRNRTEVAA